MGLGARERLNLLELRKDLKEVDPAVVAIMDKKFRDDPYVVNVPITLTVVDPFLEISRDEENVNSGGYRSTFNLGQALARYLVEELDPAWWTPKWGASWFIRTISDLDPMVDLEAEERRAPGRTSKQSSYPDGEDTKLTFANVEEGLRWAVAYIDANQDDIKELLDDLG
jgi:hypothetical protein